MFESQSDPVSSWKYCYWVDSDTTNMFRYRVQVWTKGQPQGQVTKANQGNCLGKVKTVKSSMGPETTWVTLRRQNGKIWPLTPKGQERGQHRASNNQLTLLIPKLAKHCIWTSKVTGQGRGQRSPFGQTDMCKAQNAKSSKIENLTPKVKGQGQGHPLE